MQNRTRLLFSFSFRREFSQCSCFILKCKHYVLVEMTLFSLKSIYQFVYVHRVCHSINQVILTVTACLLSNKL